MPLSASKSYRIQTLANPTSLDITDIFAPFAAQPWAMLLDSANSQHVNARYDIMVAQPIATLSADGRRCQIWQQEGDSQQQHDGNPIAILKQLLADTLPNYTASNDYQLPFTIGAMGYFGYDLGRVFEDLPSVAEHNYQTPDMAVGIYAWSLVKDKQSGKIYVIDTPEHPAPSHAQLIAGAQQANLSNSSFGLTGEWQANMDKAAYCKNIQRIHQYLTAGDCYQVNLAQRFEAPYTGDEWQAYLRLRVQNTAPFSAFIRLPQSAILSISPERFIKVKQRQVQSQPIKGTRPRDTDPKRDQQHIEDLQRSQKDQAENLMIVDLLRNDLSKSCVDGSIQVPALFAIESFEAVHHLVSTVVGTLAPEQHPLDLLQHAFPGGSITGAPKIRAMEIIEELEPHRRNIYCGSIGYLDISGNMDTSICIRTLLCEQQQIYCWAGGGIVLDSQADAEYQESFDKVSKILPVLAQ